MTWLELSPADRRRGSIATKHGGPGEKNAAIASRALVVLLCGLVGASEIEYGPPKVKTVPGTPDYAPVEPALPNRPGPLSAHSARRLSRR